MRFEGSITSWNEERGFGFVQADHGGQEIFVHIKTFPRHAGIPRPDQRISFEVESRDGKKRARNVALIQPARMVRQRRKDSPAGRGVAGYFPILAFAIIYLFAAIAWHIPNLVAVAYIGASVLCFTAYALDKFAARTGRWRIAESTLLLLGFACGWPGAILAQQWLRHKSSKTSFRLQFWATAVFNIAVFVYLSSPVSFLRQI